MNRNSGNVSKTKKLIPGVGNNSKLNRKSFHKLSDSSSISSNRNSSAHSEEDVRVSGSYLRPQVDNNISYDVQEQVTKKLQGQVKELRHKLRILEESVDSKDYSLGTISREKDRAIGEIRRLERNNKQLRQQLNEERNHYLEEKEKFCEEMTKYKKKLQAKESDGKKSKLSGKQSLINQSLKWQLNKEKGDFEDPKTYLELKQSKSQKFLRGKEKIQINQSSISFSDFQLNKRSSIESLHLYEGNDVSLQMAALRTENAKLRSIICERDERNYELCLRFLRMKHYKNDIRSRFQDLENEYLQVIANLMDKIDEARQEFNFIIDQKFRRPLHSTNAMYLQMVQKNSRMAFENASLRLENQCLKKELSKHVSTSVEFDRKNDFGLGSDELESKSTPGDQKTDGKMKIKKNVNFNEIQTIYERDMNFKNSDTDSNYMSKTSTTGPSIGSLGDPKSNESIIGGEENNSNRIQVNFQASSLPNEILHKIFKRIDTSSCQTIDSGRSKVDANLKTGIPEGGERVSNGLDDPRKVTQTSEIVAQEIFCKEVQKEPIIIEHKSVLKMSDSSSPCESKESIRFEIKETSDRLPVSPARTKVVEKENFPVAGKQEKKTWTFKNRLKSHVQGRWSFDRDSEDGSGSFDFPMRRFTFAGRSRLGRKEKVQQSKAERQVSQTRSMYRTSHYIDSCGLQEKLEFSDLELSSSATVDNRIQTTGEVEKTRTQKPDIISTRIEMIESDDEDLGLKTGKHLTIEAITPAIGSRSRSINKLNLHDELMEVARRQINFDESWQRVAKQQSIQSKTDTFLPEKDNYNFTKNHQCGATQHSLITQDSRESARISDLLQNRRSEGSKRFSHRLISTSPEQLRNLLTESELGFQMAPTIVGHATTEISPALNYEESKNEIFLQLVLPQESSEQTSQVYLNKETTEKPIVTKKTSTSVPSPIHPTKSINQVEVCSSDIRIPIPNLPSSNSTMEMVNSTAFDRSNIMMRTLSAPGLLESSWLDPYNICEMRDCGLGKSVWIRFQAHEAVSLYSHFPSHNETTLHIAVITVPLKKQ